MHTHILFSQFCDLCHKKNTRLFFVSLFYSVASSCCHSVFHFFALVVILFLFLAVIFHRLYHRYRFQYVWANSFVPRDFFLSSFFIFRFEDVHFLPSHLKMQIFVCSLSNLIYYGTDLNVFFFFQWCLNNDPRLNGNNVAHHCYCHGLVHREKKMFEMNAFRVHSKAIQHVLEKFA